MSPIIRDDTMHKSIVFVKPIAPREAGSANWPANAALINNVPIFNMFVIIAGPAS